MIGEQQAKGYSDIVHREKELEQDLKELDAKEELEDAEKEFDDRKKRALESIGRSDQPQEIKKEDIASIAQAALQNTAENKKHKDKVLEHDIMVLRMQNDKIIRSLNALTVEIKNLKDELRRKNG